MLKKRLKPVYLLFLAIPLVYFLLWNSQKEASVSDSKLPDYFFSSVRISRPATICLNAGNDSLYKWNISSAGYKNLQYVGPINDSAGFNLIIKDLDIHDTISFLGFNFFHNHKVFSLCNDLEKFCDAVNADLTVRNGILIAIVRQSGTPVNIHIKPFSTWGTDDINNRTHLITILIFIIAFLFIIVLAPPARYFIVSVVISLMVMILCFMADFDFSGRVSMSSSTQIKGAEVFFNQDPFFTPNKRFSSNDITKEYSVPVNLKADGFLRCDVADNTAELKDFQIKIKSGVFSSTLDLASVPQERLVLNDLVLQGNTYYVTGNDPYIALTSAYFIQKIKWLLFLERNIFLFITLIVFLILVSMNRFVDGLSRIKFKWAYFAYLLIPLSYCLITQPWRAEIKSHYADQLYFSARTSRPSVISLFNGNDSVTSWTLSSPGYKYLQYSGNIKRNTGLWLRIENLSANDTISLLSINLYHDDCVYSLFDKNEVVCKMKNARSLDEPGELNVGIRGTNEAVIINLLPFNLLKKDQSDQRMEMVVLFIIFLTFIVVVLVAPGQRYFIISCIVVSLLMLLFSWLGSDVQDQTTLETSMSLKSTECFYNDQPSFIRNQKRFTFKDSCLFKSQVDLVTCNFIRWDVLGNTEEIKDLRISTKMGLVKSSWDYSAMSQENLLMNDLIKRGRTYYICGDDPYFVLTSAGQIQSIKWIVQLRQNIFFFLTILFFLIITIANKPVKKLQPANVFLAGSFLVLISSGLILHLFNSERILMIREKRLANLLPGFQLDSTKVMVTKLDDYFNDQLTGRNNMITTNNLIGFFIFKQLANNPSVHFGEDGWMFYMNERIREMYENRHPLTEQELIKMKDVLVTRRDWLQKRNIYFYIMFPPSSCYIYKEKVGPRLHQFNNKSRIDQLLEYLKLNTDLDIIDIYTPMMEAKKKCPYILYYKNDPHWNFVGSYFAYRAMVDHIKKKFPDVGDPLLFNDIKWLEFDDNNAGLLRINALDKYYTCHQYYPQSKNLMTATDTLYPDYPKVMEAWPPVSLINNRGHRPKMLMFRDSFAYWLTVYLVNNFNRSTYIWTPFFHPDIVEQEKPDMVILEMADNLIYDILAQNPPLTPMKDTIQSNPE
jgi:alginate O-acetyltransferase complex protein AlgJ